MMASQNGHSAVVDALLAKGAETDVRANDGVTALIAASNADHFTVVKALLANGADVDVQTNNGVTALSAAHTVGIKKMLRAAAKP
jgi:serine/threonine-protein phosphatase 6 regulatory ankyrin repeat subunit B